MIKKTLLVIATLLSFWGAARFTHHQTKGFRLSKLIANTAPIPVSQSPISLEIEKILQQDFHYLGRGLQSFSFVSEDGTTVLKLFNNRYQNRLFWLQFLPGIGPLKNWRDTKIAYNQRKWKEAFASYELAFENLKNEAGLLFLHTSPSKDCPIVTIIDNLQIAHRIDLSTAAFALQKKMDTAYPYLNSCAHDPIQIKNALSSLISLLKKKMDLGIGDNDPLIRTNFGFIEKQAMQIDIGPFSWDPSLKNIDRQKVEIAKITVSLRHWLEKHHPEHLQILDEVLENL